MEEENNLNRCFIALELPKEILEEINRIQKLIRKNNLFTGKFTEIENLHLTLKFLGEIDDKRVEDVRERLKKIKINKFESYLGEIGVFSKDFIKIIWVKLHGKPIWELQEKIDESLLDMFPKEERFMGHITIARVKYVPDKKELIKYLESIKPKKINFFCDRFFLKKSELLPEGPIYTNIESYKLSNNTNL